MSRKRRGRPKSYRKHKSRSRGSAFKIKLKSSSIRSISSVLLLSAALLTLLSYVGQSIGPDNILQDLLNRYFGLGAIFIPLILTIFGLYLTGVKWGFSRANVWVGLTIFQIAFISLISPAIWTREPSTFSFISAISIILGVRKSVWFIIFMSSFFANLFSNLGAIILISTVLFVSLLITLDASLTETLNMIGNTLVGFFKVIKEIFTHLFNKEQQISLKDIKASNENTSKSLPQVEENLATDKDKKEMKVIDPSLRQVTDSNQASMKKEKEKTENLDGLKEETVFANLPVSDKVWEYPPLSLLSDKPPVPADRGDIKQNAHKIEKALDSFGIRAKVIEVNCGPSVTQYALELTEGTKIAKVTFM